MSVEGPLPPLKPGECDHVRVERVDPDSDRYASPGGWRCRDCGALLPPGPPPVPRWRRKGGA